MAMKLNYNTVHEYVVTVEKQFWLKKDFQLNFSTTRDYNVDYKTEHEYAILRVLN